MSDDGKRIVAVTITRNGMGTVLVDGHDISAMVAGLWLSADPKDGLSLNITLAPDVLQVTGPAEVTASRPVVVK